MDDDEYRNKNTLMDKMKKDPTVPIGVVGLACIVTYGLYNFRKRKSTPASIYLIHMRLAGQGAVIGCITLGLLYTFTSTHLSKLWKDKK